MQPASKLVWTPKFVQEAGLASTTHQAAYHGDSITKQLKIFTRQRSQYEKQVRAFNVLFEIRMCSPPPAREREPSWHVPTSQSILLN